MVVKRVCIVYDVLGGSNAGNSWVVVVVVMVVVTFL